MQTNHRIKNHGLFCSIIALLVMTPVMAEQDKDPRNHPLPRKVVTFTRADIMQDLTVVQIRCHLNDDLLHGLVPSKAHVKTKPNRYIITDWKMHLNELYCNITQNHKAQSAHAKQTPMI